MIRPVPKHGFFAMEGYQVWCPSVVRTADGVFHMLFSRWPLASGHHAWVTQSEVAYATASSLMGPYTFSHVVLRGSGHGRWDGDVVHNPTVLEHDGRYYMYYMGNYGNGEYWDHRNHQRIGAAWADHPAGPWQRLEQPVVNISPGAWDHLMVSNPIVARGPDGRFIMVYKGVSDGPLPAGGAVVCGVAAASHPLGPFEKIAGPIMVNPEHDRSVEDPYIWVQDGRFYAIVKDFQGYFTRTGASSLALFESADGIDWKPAESPLALRKEIAWENGTVEAVAALERPYIWFDGGRPAALLCAAAFDEERQRTANIIIPLSPER